MAFLITTSQSTVCNGDFAPGNTKPAGRTARVRTKANASLLTSPPTEVLEVSGLVAGQSVSSPAWIVFEGYIQDRSGKPHAAGPTGAERVLAAILGHGVEEGLRKLKGSFIALVAFPAINRFFVTTDSLGARLAFYCVNGNSISIASQAHLLARLSRSGCTPDPTYIAWMFSLRNDTPEGRSAFKDVSEIKPGELLEITPSSVVGRPRALDISPSATPKTTEGWIDAFERQFTVATRDSFSTDESVCVMLSGGLDSGPVAAVAARKLKNVGKKVGAVSWKLTRFPKADESRHVASLAKHIGAELITFDGDEFLPFSLLDGSISQADRPQINFYRPLIRRCYELARDNGYGVILNGNAGDLLYMNHQWLMSDQLRRMELIQMLDLLREGRRIVGLRKMMHFQPLRSCLRRLLRGAGNASYAMPAWLTDYAASQAHDVHGHAEALQHPFPGYARNLLGTRIGTGNAYENTIAGAYGLERRDPYINEDLVKLALSMPFSMSYRNGTTKWIMREAMKRNGYLPESFRTKPRTGILTEFLDAGFDANRKQIADFLFREHTEWQAWINPAPVQRAVSDHQESHRDRALAAVSIGYCSWLDKIKGLPKIEVT